MEKISPTLKHFSKTNHNLFFSIRDMIVKTVSISACLQSCEASLEQVVGKLQT